jgi:hypothetical protein
VKIQAKLMSTLVSSAVLAMAVVVAGCGSDDNNRSDSTGASAGGTSAAQAPAPTDSSSKVAFVTPKDDATEQGTVKVKVKLTNFKIDATQIGKSPQPGIGHLHFAMDGGKYDNSKYSGPNGKLAEQLGVDGKYSPSITPKITYTDLPPGKHQLEVYLANNNHTPTGVEAETEFTVK